MSLEAQFSTNSSILQELHHSDFEKYGLEVFVKRDDLIHPLVSGNKWRKLKYSLLQAESLKYTGILTFGGAYSNHLVACAAACKEVGFNSIGVVRGDELNPESNPLLKRCSDLGMQLIFIDRMEYGMRNDYEYTNELKAEHPGYYVVPEGGANYYGMIGCQEIWSELPVDIDCVFVAQGTTATSCGILLGMPEKCSLHVVPVLKGFDSKAEMNTLLQKAGFDSDAIVELLQKVNVYDDFHFGGYGKVTAELSDFIEEQQKKYRLPLDETYTGKAFYAMMDQIGKGNFQAKKLVFIHTGGVHSF